MSVPALRKALCYVVLLAITPYALFADDQAAAMIYCKGTVLVNGNPLPDSSAIQSGDTIQTETDSVATITEPGTSVIVQPATVMKFSEGAITLQQGSISVAGSQGIVTTAGTMTAIPVAGSWSEYEVSILNADVEVIARKATLTVDCGKETVTLSEGMHAISDPSGKCNTRKKAGAYPPASGDILSNPYWKYIAAGVGGGVLIWLLWPGPQKPASPAAP
jgi:hypothetical protein